MEQRTYPVDITQAFRITDERRNNVYTIYPGYTWGRKDQLSKSPKRFAWFHNMPWRATFGSDRLENIADAIEYMTGDLGYKFDTSFNPNRDSSFGSFAKGCR